MDMTENNRSDGRSDTVKLDERCRRRRDCGLDLLLDRGELGIESSHVGEMLARESLASTATGSSPTSTASWNRVP